MTFFQCSAADVVCEVLCWEFKSPPAGYRRNVVESDIQERGQARNSPVHKAVLGWETY
jgi:hypothetical protein